MTLFQPTPTTQPLYSRHAQGLGTFTLRPLHLPEDLALIHEWVTAPRAHFWGMQGHTPERVQALLVLWPSVTPSAATQSSTGPARTTGRPPGCSSRHWRQPAPTPRAVT